MKANENIVRIADDVKGEGYIKLIDYAISRCDSFVLAVRDEFQLGERGKEVLSKLDPFLIKKLNSKEWPGTRSMSGNCKVYYFKCCKYTAQILKGTADSLFSWLDQNGLPEDLSFLTGDGKEWLVNVAHERYAYLNIDEQERQILSETVTGLFLRGSFNKDIFSLLRDAKRHNAERLEIEGLGISELPEEICELVELRSLRIFEGEVSKIPERIGKLTKLEELSVLVKDLTEIPVSVKNLRKLKRLEILCASEIIPENRKAPIKPLGKSSLSKLPDEIGELTELESIRISATSIRKLPKSIGKLKKLKFLNLTWNSLEELPEEIGELEELTSLWLDRNMLKSVPDTVSKLKKLNYLNLSGNGFSKLPEAFSKLKGLHVTLSNDMPEDFWKEILSEE